MYGRLFFIFAIFVLAACQNDKTTTTEPPEKEKTPVTIPRFDRDSAFAFVQKQTEFGPRTPNTEAHQQTRVWLVDQFKKFGAEVIEQNFEATAYTGEVFNSTNIIAQYNPSASKRVILAAHWDTRHIADHDPSEENQEKPVKGADDGGSGVGVLLEVARQIQQNPIDMGVDIILFDAEDNGDGSEQGKQESWCLGSQYWSRNPHKKGYDAKYGILLDMVGGKNAQFTKDAVSRSYAPRVLKKTWDLAKSMGYGNYFIDKNTGPLTDDHYFVNLIAKIPMIDIINLPNNGNPPFVDHWHTTEDTIDKIDPRTLRAVGQVVLAVIYRESGGIL